MEAKKSKIIKLDVDGVIRDCTTPLLKIYNKLSDDNVKYEQLSDWNYDVNFKNGHRYSDLFLAHPKEIFENAPLYEENIVDILNTIKHNGYLIHITTHQYHGLEKYTVNWLHKNNIPYDYMSFVKDKTLVYGDVMIEDALHNLEASKKIGEQTICVDRPWNQEWVGPRIKKLEELIK